MTYVIKEIVRQGVVIDKAVKYGIYKRKYGIERKIAEFTTKAEAVAFAKATSGMELFISKLGQF